MGSPMHMAVTVGTSVLTPIRARAPDTHFTDDDSDEVAGTGSSSPAQSVAAVVRLTVRYAPLRVFQPSV